MKALDIEQRSDEWFAVRCGKATASRISDVMARIKSGEAAARRDYRAQLVAERLTQMPQETFSNAAMQWGTDMEPHARMAYEGEFLMPVVEVGFVLHPTIEMAGCSPDGLVGNDGLIEIKCPKTATHIEWVRSGSAPRQHLYQMQWQMACTGRQWCDFVSYDPRLADASLFIARVQRDNELIAELEREVRQFLDEVDAELVALTSCALRVGLPQNGRSVSPVQ